MLGVSAYSLAGKAEPQSGHELGCGETGVHDSERSPVKPLTTAVPLSVPGISPVARPDQENRR
jgi:hypothetical protein